jgi:hypothetical protein
MKQTQCEMIVDYIDEYGSISALEALRDLGVYRLASRIADLKKQGHKIKSEMVSVATRNGGRTHIAKYSWEEDNAKKDGKECEKV